ncbi:Uma2 family endonuclease [Limnothrix sp. FACHB-708]|uniref:Uma2 family endonuclease n=1 Tax=unclassified Limnothrix TaxID=2632864 RepID=UPI0016820124|nr:MULTISPECIES: Uma2 family endonuclease [unclassified Limnothrix]MBD2554412.1 Uma2 family endonuclease [Limnothrix sp. FACHB-708]MBD2589396.1 Uma2 family endonuclease [Limnothrix sp. FACHB-406]
MSIALLPEPAVITADDYLAQEVLAETRNEYRNGVVVPMTGGTPEHNFIAINLITILKFALRGQAYDLALADQRLWIPEPNLYTYPDVMVAKRPIERKPDRTDTVMNPILIAEVLSKSTAAYDRTEKFAAYRTIASLQNYLLIDQYQPHVELYARTGDQQWLFSEYGQLSDRVLLDAVSVELPLADLYEAIEFGGEA